MEELKPCPFCGGEKPNPIEHAADCYYRMFYEMMLPHNEVVYPEEKLREAWNHRAERTCDDIGNDSFVCSKCGFDCHVTSKQDGLSIPDYCPSCGAKVVI